MAAVGKCEILENEVKNSSNIVEIVYNSVLNIKKTKIRILILKYIII